MKKIIFSSFKISTIIFSGIIFFLSCTKHNDPTPSNTNITNTTNTSTTPVTNTTNSSTTNTSNATVPGPKTNQDYLTAHTWIITAATSDVALDINNKGITPSKNIYAQYDACTYDDSYVFSNTVNTSNQKTGTYDNGANKCTGWPQVLSFVWSLDSAQIHLTMFAGTANPSVYTITQINDQTFTVTSSESDFFSSTPYTLTTTYTAQ